MEKNSLEAVFFRETNITYRRMWEPDFDRGCGVACGYKSEHSSDVASGILPASYPQASYLANPQLGFHLCQNGIGSIISRPRRGDVP
jgi:hypothetical protein